MISCPIYSFSIIDDSKIFFMSYYKFFTILNLDMVYFLGVILKLCSKHVTHFTFVLTNCYIKNDNIFPTYLVLGDRSSNF